MRLRPTQRTTDRTTPAPEMFRLIRPGPIFWPLFAGLAAEGVCSGADHEKTAITPGSPRRELLLGSPPDMTTKLEKELKREIDVDGKHYTVTISPGGLKIAEKGHRKGHELSWKQILSSDPQLAQDLAKSVEQPPTPPQGSSGP